MPKLTVREGEEWTSIPHQTLLEARVADIELVEREYEAGKPVKRLSWTFTVTEDGEFKGRDIRSDTPVTFVASPSCIAYNWAAAISGHQFTDGDEFDTDDLIGLPCRVLVHEKTSKGGNKYNKVDQVIPSTSRPENSPF